MRAAKPGCGEAGLWSILNISRAGAVLDCLVRRPRGLLLNGQTATSAWRAAVGVRVSERGAMVTGEDGRSDASVGQENEAARDLYAAGRDVTIIHNHEDRGASGGLDQTAADRPAPSPAGASEVGASATPPSRPSVPAAHDVQFSTEFWLTYLQSDVADHMLAANPSPLKDGSSPLSELDELVTRALGIDGLSMAVRMESEPIAVRVFSRDQFWAALLADLALLRQRPGNMRWLLRETITGDGRRAELRRIGEVWECIYRNFLSPGSGVNREDLFGRLVNAGLETAGRDRLKGQLRFLLDLAKDDANLKLIFRNALEGFCQARNDLSPPRLSDLFYLIGDASDDLQRSDPGLVRIKLPGSLLYDFEVMRRPLTVGHARALSPLLAGDRGNPLLPFRFLPPERFRTYAEFYQNLRKELMAILRLMPSQADKDDGLQWDVPTFSEWLRLAGCEHQRFPWGTTSSRTTLTYGSRAICRTSALSEVSALELRGTESMTAAGTSTR